MSGQRRSGKPVPCPWCKSATSVQAEIAGIGWRVVCTAPFFGPAPCRVAGPIRMDCLQAVAAWNEVVGLITAAQQAAG